MSCAWGLTALFFIMFYNSNLRTRLVTPDFEPEINSVEDVLEQDIRWVHVHYPQEYIDWLAPVKVVENQDLYNKVSFGTSLLTKLFNVSVLVTPLY